MSSLTTSSWAKKKTLTIVLLVFKRNQSQLDFSILVEERKFFKMRVILVLFLTHWSYVLDNKHHSYLMDKMMSKTNTHFPLYTCHHHGWMAQRCRLLIVTHVYWYRCEFLTWVSMGNSLSSNTRKKEWPTNLRYNGT